MWNFKAFIAALITAAVLAVPLTLYWNFLTKGMRPPEGTLRLDQLEKNGIPDFTLPDMAGNPVSLSQFRGKLVLVNLWATWCAPCVKEIPSLKGLVEKMKGETIVLAVSHDRSREDIETFIKAFGGLPKDFVVVWDKDRVTAKLFGTDALPETYIVDRHGRLVRKVAGETVWDDPMALDFFQDALKR